jgi:hypothetical protein
MKRPYEVYVLCLLLLFLSVGAIYGGISLIISPDGSMLKMDSGWLNLIPFSSFLIPGIILFVFLGIIPLFSLTGLFYRKKIPAVNFLNIYPGKNWGWTFSLYSGIICITWIIIQQMLTDFFFLQPIIAAVGVLIVVICLMPCVQRFYTVRSVSQIPDSINS